MAYLRENLVIRNKIFLVAFTLFFLGFFVNDRFDWIDECLVAYAFICLLCMMNLVLFSWWWIRTGKASDVYKWLMVLMSGVLVTNLGNLHSRWLFVVGDIEAYHRLLCTTAWKYRAVPTLIALGYMSALIIARICCSSEDSD